MLAAVKAVKAGRADLFGGALRTSLLAGRRPHVLFGTKELVTRRTPKFLPPLLHSAFQTYKPEDGNLTKEADRVAVRGLTEEARKDVVEPPHPTSMCKHVAQMTRYDSRETLQDKTRHLATPRDIPVTRPRHPATAWRHTATTPRQAATPLRQTRDIP